MSKNNTNINIFRLTTKGKYKYEYIVRLTKRGIYEYIIDIRSAVCKYKYNNLSHLDTQDKRWPENLVFNDCKKNIYYS